MSTSHELRVADLMTTAVHTLSPSQSLPLAEAFMGLARVRHVPVVSDSGELVGLVTHRDLLSAKISALVPLSPDERTTLELRVPVSRVMRTEVWTIGKSALAVSAARIMRDHHFGCLPVVDGRRLVGIITEADLLALVTDSIALERPRPMTAERAMTPAPVTITPATSIAQARTLMARWEIRHLPVVENCHAIAIVSDRDLRVAEVVFRETAQASATHAARLVGTDVVHRVPADAVLSRVFREMFESRIDAAVVEKDGRLVGVLTASDACRLLGEGLGQRRAPGE
jgi:CBS domain-containing membrane protein